MKELLELFDEFIKVHQETYPDTPDKIITFINDCKLKIINNEMILDEFVYSFENYVQTLPSEYRFLAYGFCFNVLNPYMNCIDNIKITREYIKNDIILIKTELGIKC